MVCKSQSLAQPVRLFSENSEAKKYPCNNSEGSKETKNQMNTTKLKCTCSNVSTETMTIVNHKLDATKQPNSVGNQRYFEGLFKS